jgi:uncharacterized membrane protein
LDSTEELLVAFISWVEMAAEFIAALSVAVGIVFVVYRAITIRVMGKSLAVSSQSFQTTRLLFSHYLVMALELQLAADILSTAVAPSWAQVGKLAAIATIRTFLNYFLGREMSEVELETSAPSTRAPTE